MVQPLTVCHDFSTAWQASGLETAVARLRDELGELRAAPVTGPAKTWGVSPVGRVPGSLLFNRCGFGVISDLMICGWFDNSDASADCSIESKFVDMQPSLVRMRQWCYCTTCAHRSRNTWMLHTRLQAYAPTRPDCLTGMIAIGYY